MKIGILYRTTTARNAINFKYTYIHVLNTQTAFIMIEYVQKKHI
jgi:hypothetical protein